MSNKSKYYSDSKTYHALRVKATNTRQSVFEVGNESVRLALHEDAEDLRAFEERAEEPMLSYETLLKDLKSYGKL
ncbi:MAG: CopG family transcriptional regulator [Phycisphaerales bacterium]|nr:CopG family transcriptional regulator [Phycisphaerales bacterium]